MTHPSQSAESAQGLSEPANITAIRKRYAAFEELNTSDALNHVYASTWTTIRDLLAEIDRLRTSQQTEPVAHLDCLPESLPPLSGERTQNDVRKCARVIIDHLRAERATQEAEVIERCAEADDEYSLGMDAGARHQVKACVTKSKLALIQSAHSAPESPWRKPQRRSPSARTTLNTRRLRVARPIRLSAKRRPSWLKSCAPQKQSSRKGVAMSVSKTVVVRGRRYWRSAREIERLERKKAVRRSKELGRKTRRESDLAGKE